MSKPIRVVVVDDSALMRQMITSMLERDPAIQIVGVARNGREAIDVVQELRPDVVTMDVRMPIMDGLETTEHLMAYCPTPILVLTALSVSQDVDITFKMLGAGALEVIEKPRSNDPQEFERTGYELIRRIKVLSRVRVVTHLRGRRKNISEAGVGQGGELLPSTDAQRHLPAQVGDPVKRRRGGTGMLGQANRAKTSATQEPAPRTRTRGTDLGEMASHAQLAPLGSFPLVVIGASTGGPRIVYQLLSELPRDFAAAVVVIQHIAEGFSSGMAEWLASASSLPISLAFEGQLLQPGEVLLTPDRRDILITSIGAVHLSDNPLLIQRPSIDITMQAAADVFGPLAIGVLLTGMGRDGAYGMLTIQKAGGYTIAQDEASSTIFGMPRAAIELGAAQEVLPPAQIAPRLVALVQQLKKAQAKKKDNSKR